MPATYRFVPNADYFFTRRRRFQQQGPFLLRPSMRPLIAIAPLLLGWLALWVFAPDVEAEVRSTFVGAAAFLVGGLAVIQVIFRWRIKANESKFKELTYTLSNEGVFVHDSLSESKLSWGAYPSTVRFADGILLVRTRFFSVWLPDAALQGATPQEVTALVQSKTQLRHVA